MSVGYTADPFSPSRRRTREVRVGDVGIGGDNPIRVQSMTTTDTRDTDATVDQIVRLVDAGCEIARVTAPSITEAENLAAIAGALRARGIGIPLVADIHFTPNAAMIAAEHVEKVRINPGNYADKKKFEVREYSDAAYAAELERVRDRFRPLVLRCRELGRAMRIGTNHGSLSDRVMNRFGDTPRGMVESALEFLDVCEDEGYRDVVFSMKSSNAQVAVQAYRMLAARLEGRMPGEPAYPFHIGVTEAGDGEDGRIKSAIGVGSLLEDGIGDTIRVSLTEDPVREIPVARILARRYEARQRAATRPVADPGAPFSEDPFAHQRRVTRSVNIGDLAVGGANPVRVEIEIGGVPTEPNERAADVARSLAALRDVECESLLVDALDPGAVAALPAFIAALRDAGVGAPVSVRGECDFAALGPEAARLVLCVGELVSDDEIRAAAGRAKRSGVPIEWELRGSVTSVSLLVDRVLEASAREGLESLLVSADADLPVHAARLLAARLRARGARDVPIVLRHRRESCDDEAALVAAAVDLGAPLCDGIGDLVAVSGFGDPAYATALAYRVLQGARQRTSWTEFISCPSCGRTLFDLEETTARIKARTNHLRGVKIAIMGCIVNGPGEMADADFGYVGSGPGRVNLYVGHELVERSIPDTQADDRLIDLIREHGRWVDP